MIYFWNMVIHSKVEFEPTQRSKKKVKSFELITVHVHYCESRKGHEKAGRRRYELGLPPCAALSFASTQQQSGDDGLQSFFCLSLCLVIHYSTSYVIRIIPTPTSKRE